MAQERSKGMKANPSFLPNGQPAPANDSGSFSDILQAEVERFAENGDKWPSSNEVLVSQPKSTSVAETKAKVDAQLRAAGVLDTPAAAGEGNAGKAPADQPGRSASGRRKNGFSVRSKAPWPLSRNNPNSTGSLQISRPRSVAGRFQANSASSCSSNFCSGASRDKGKQPLTPTKAAAE